VRLLGDEDGQGGQVGPCGGMTSNVSRRRLRLGPGQAGEGEECDADEASGAMTDTRGGETWAPSLPLF